MSYLEIWRFLISKSVWVNKNKRGRPNDTVFWSKKNIIFFDFVLSKNVTGSVAKRFSVFLIIGLVGRNSKK